MSINDKIKSFPHAPGCYLFFDNKGYVIYVGKSKNLNSRVRSYFTKSAAEDERISQLVKQIYDVRYIIMDSELDALIEEYRLIKEYRPWFNSQLKPDKIRPYLRISNDSPYATITITDNVLSDDATYYDFFTDEYDVMDAIATIGKTWGLPQCRKRSFSKRQSPCSYQSLDRCMAPCSHLPKKEEYQEAIDAAIAFLNGDDSIFIEINATIYKYSIELAYEKATTVKRLYDDLTRLRAKSKRRFHIPNEGSFLVLIRPYKESAFSAFYIVDGAVMARQNFTGSDENSIYQEFARSLRTQRASIENSEWLPSCLVNIIAKKEIVPIPPRSNYRIVVSALKRFAAT